MDDLLSLLSGEPEPDVGSRSSLGDSPPAIGGSDGKCTGLRNFDELTVDRGRAQKATTHKHSGAVTPDASCLLRRDEGKPTPRKSTTTLCEHTCLRIVNRRVSRLDLVDALAPHDFRTTPTLASMSTRDLSSLVTVPGKDSYGNGGGGFAGGKTNIATMGVLFKNSGTKLSSNGRAFCVFTIGDLSAGPCVSVYLFGDAYSCHTKSGCLSGRHGSMVAILAPNVLPPRKGGDTSISLSVNDERQVLAVGVAQDFGTCAGMAWAKRGGEVNKTRCTNYVDLRLSRYCRMHQRQANQMVAGKCGVAGLGETSSCGAGSTFIQKARAEHASDMMFAAYMIAPTSKTNRKVSNQVPSTNANCTSLLIRGSGGRNGIAPSSALSVALAASGISSATPANSSHPGTLTMDTPAGTVIARAPSYNAVRQLRAPMHMKKGVADYRRNPYDQLRKKAPAGAKSVSGQTESSYRSSKPAESLALDVAMGRNTYARKKGGKRQANSCDAGSNAATERGQKRRKIAKFEDFDGSVQVPKPSHTLFGGNRAPCFPESLRSDAPIVESRDQQDILERQRLLAGRIQLRKSDVCNERNSDTLVQVAFPSPKNQPGANSSVMDSLFQGLDSLDREEILSAKSKYQSEADAEQYARSRQAVAELEKKESRHEMAERKKQGKVGREATDKTGLGIMTLWVCSSCSRASATKPFSCVIRNHSVRKVREISAKKGESVTRDKLHKKDSDDGGMTLGQGLEWSGWRGSV